MFGAAALVPVAALAWFATAQLERRFREGGAVRGGSVTRCRGRAVGAARRGSAAAEVRGGGSGGRRYWPDFLKKVQDLADDGNWNLFVLFAVEWTRQEPTNAVAWDQLRVGYVNMRQYDDAMVAAKKSTQLAPQDARLWRALGGVQMEVEDHKGALRSFEQAVALDAQDADSMKQVGVLNGRLGQTKEARDALEAAVAIRPDDANVLCLRSALAQSQVPVKDTQVASRQAKPFDDRCRSVVASSGRH